MTKRAFCCGNIAFDLIDRPLGASGPVFQARTGGSICNTAILLSRLGSPVSIISKTGQDFLGNTLLSVLKSEGVNTRYVFSDPKIRTSLAFASIDKKGDSSYVFYTPKGPRSKLSPTDLPKAIFSGMSVFHTASLFSYDTYNHSTVISCLKKAQANGVFVSYDPNWRSHRIQNVSAARKRVYAILPYVDLLKLSAFDAISITGRRSLSKALGDIHRLLKGDLIVTRGDQGAFYWDGKAVILQPAFKVDIKDTIGAGDGFTAGLLYRLLTAGKEKFRSEKQKNLEFAAAVSALVCTGSGATDGVKDLKQVRRFLNPLRRTLCKYTRPSL